MAVVQTGIVLRIEKTSIHDGSGLRTVVFLKGCPLRCRWCSTPESQRSSIEIGLLRHKCDGCGLCGDACPEECFATGEDGRFVFEAQKCTQCLECVDSCPTGAIKAYGETMTVSQVLEQISKDEVFYFFSGGGVTISGGECLAQPDFVEPILRECRSRGIDTAIETSLYATWDSIARVLPYLNSLFVDIKNSDSGSHKNFTGVGIEIIWENLRRLDALDLTLPIYVRIPLVPGVNDSDKNLRSILAGVSQLNKVKGIEILPYHRLGVATYEHLGREFSLKNIQTPSQRYLEERETFLKSQGTGIPINISR